MKKKQIIYALLALLCIIGLIWMGVRPKRQHYKWSIVLASELGGKEPYEMGLFDNAMYDALPDGYCVRVIPTEYKIIEVEDDEDREELDEELDEASIFSIPYHPIQAIIEASTDSALLLVESVPWTGKIFKSDNGEISYHKSVEIYPFFSMLEFARRGGKGMLVSKRNSELVGLDKVPHMVSVYSDYWVRPSGTNSWDSYTFTKEGLYERDENAIFAKGPSGDEVALNNRFAIDYFRIYPDYEPYFDSVCELSPMLTTDGKHEIAYMLDFYFPESGGHLYVTTLGLYFCNLGLDIPGSGQVLDNTLGLIADMPVKRIAYDPYNVNFTNSNVSILNVIGKNPALSFAWKLILLLILLAVACGLMRRYPAVKGIEKEDLDRTDTTKMREWKFRHSPQLHFLFQMSWLYNRDSEYSDLFLINYKQVARAVRQMADFDLHTVREDQLETLCRPIATILGIDIAEVVDDLKWMNETYNNLSIIRKIDYKYSQYIADKYGNTLINK